MLKTHRLISPQKLPWFTRMETYVEYDLGDADVVIAPHQSAGESYFVPSVNTFIVAPADADSLPKKRIQRARRNYFRFVREVNRNNT